MNNPQEAPRGLNEEPGILGRDISSEYADSYLDEIKKQEKVIREAEEFMKVVAAGWADEEVDPKLKQAHLKVIARQKEVIEGAKEEIQRILAENQKKIVKH